MNADGVGGFRDPPSIYATTPHQRVGAPHQAMRSRAVACQFDQVEEGTSDADIILLTLIGLP
jgi:hypothetical protein